MSKEGEQVFQKRSLEGFKLSPNKAADLLEQKLGIKFTEKPAVVKLDGRNKLAMIRKGGIAFALASFLKKQKSAGWYDNRYNAYFTQDNDLFVGLHENMHGFAAILNPEIPLQQDLIARAVSNRATGQSFENVDIEKMISIRVFDEGLAHWASLSVARSLPEEYDEEDLNEVENLLLNGERKQSKVSVNIKYMHKEFENLVNGKQAYEQALQMKGAKVMLTAVNAENEMSGALNSVGYFYVYRKIEQLLGNGHSVGAAITELVQHPPTSLKELIDTIS